ncbi:MAG: MATE family efflux transporter, partial [Christensenellaceae bacterium]
RKNRSLLRLTKTHFEGRALLRTCTNGSSELLTNVSMSLLNSLYNVRLMHYAGEDGVAAFGTIMYVSFIFLAVFFGYAVGSAPVIGYHYGAKNEGELKNLFKKSLILTLTSSVLMLALAQILAHPLAFLYASYDPALMELTENAFRIYFLFLLFAGFNVFSSSFFTALGNGIVSAVISFSRVAFQIACVLLLPLLWGIDGIWSAVIFAELGAFLLSMVFLFLCRKKYRYC